MPKRVKVAIFLALLFASGHALGAAEGLADTLPDACYHSGTFQQAKTETGLSSPLVSSGSYAFNCKTGLIWHTHKPIIETTVYTIKGKPVQVSEQGQISELDSRLHRALGEILNNIIGGNTDYIDKHFVTVATPLGYSLTPKKKRMRKFLKTVELANTGNRKQLTLVHSDTEFTAIEIYGYQEHDRFDASSCTAVDIIPPESCALLVK